MRILFAGPESESIYAGWKGILFATGTVKLMIEIEVFKIQYSRTFYAMLLLLVSASVSVRAQDPFRLDHKTLGPMAGLTNANGGAAFTGEPKKEKKRGKHTSVLHVSFLFPFLPLSPFPYT